MITFDSGYGKIELSQIKSEVIVKFEGTEVTRFKATNGIYMIEGAKFLEKTIGPIIKHFDENYAHEECPNCDNCDRIDPDNPPDTSHNEGYL